MGTIQEKTEVFILTEKPSVAKDIAAALGGFAYDKAGFYRRGGDCIVPASGHVLELFLPEDYDEKYEKWSLENLPIVPQKMRYKPIEKTKAVLQKIKACFKNFDSTDFVLATDADREGELIGALILDYVHFANYSGARRFWVSEALTQEVVLNGLKNARPLAEYEPYKNSGYSRQHADWLIGMNATQLVTLQTGKFLTFGRVQTAVLGAIYLRDRSIANFKSEPYFQYRIAAKKLVSNDTKSGGMEFDMRLTAEDGGERFSSSRAAPIEAARNEAREGCELIVASVSRQKKIEMPPQLLNITGLQKLCAKLHQMSPKRTLEVAQELYEKLKCLSYPRTASTVLGDDNVELYREKLALLAKAYPEFADGCHVEKADIKNRRLFNSEKAAGHHALIPLAVLPENATEEQKTVYAVVLRQFFNMVKEPHEYMQTEVVAKSAHCMFKATGKTVMRQGWKRETISVSNDTEETAQLPELHEGERLSVMKGVIVQKETQPKKHFTNATLLSMMENPKSEDAEHARLAGIGTGATRAAIIDELLRRQYIRQENQYLLITGTGKFLIETVLETPALANFISIKTTTEWEQMLQDNPEKFLSGIKEFVKTEIPKIAISRKWQAPEEDSLGICPECRKGKILAGKKNYSCSEYRNGCAFAVWRAVSGCTVTASDVKLLLQGKKTRVKKMTSKSGKPFSASLVLHGKKLEFVFPRHEKLGIK